MAFQSDANKPGDSVTATDPSKREFMISAPTVESPEGGGALGIAVDSTTEESGLAVRALDRRGRRNLAARVRIGPHAGNITCVGDWRG